MSKPDTSREAVEMLAHEHTSEEFIRGITSPRRVYTAATLRALEAERDAAVYMMRNLAHALGEARAERDALLAALQDILALAEASHDAAMAGQGHTSRPWPDEFVAARAAIAKARGETP
jgi:hypothetical protein